MGDVLGSAAAIVAALVIQFTGWLPIDPLISAFISLLILASAWRLIRESATILLDKVPPHLEVPEVEGRLLAVAGVERVHDVHVWTVTSGLVAMSAHAVVPELSDHPATLRRLGDEMLALGIGHVTIQLETGGPCGGEDCGDEALVDEGRAAAHDRMRVVALTVIAGTMGPQTATLTLDIEGKQQTVQSAGNGPVDATFNAIRQIIPHQAKLLLYQVHAVTEGTDAQAEVSVRLDEDGRTVTGRGADTDTLVASARAYVSALNKLTVKRQKTAAAKEAL